MKTTRIISALISAAVSVSSVSAMLCHAEDEEIYRCREREIEYYESEHSLSTNNDGVSLRRNIYNIWGSLDYNNFVEDIEYDNVIIDHIAVDFTVSGIGSDSELVKDDGTVEPFCAWLCGSVGTNSLWKLEEAGDGAARITGDGDYTVVWNIDDASESVECLILQTNINYFAYLPEDTPNDEKIPQNGSAQITVNSIRTLSEGEILPGDVNLDASVSISDAVRILQYIANPEKYNLSAAAKKAADVNGYDDGITGQDALSIQKYDAGIIDVLPEPKEIE
ncbi:MAG: dockerin type I repeat-containing protein [Ruminococcus sp.]|nr:dockerin type I repeat-containing protein [Ruminococcus sp.]